MKTEMSRSECAKYVMRKAREEYVDAILKYRQSPFKSNLEAQERATIVLDFVTDTFLSMISEKK